MIEYCYTVIKFPRSTLREGLFHRKFKQDLNKRFLSSFTKSPYTRSSYLTSCLFFLSLSLSFSDFSTFLFYEAVPRTWNDLIGDVRDEIKRRVNTWWYSSYKMSLVFVELVRQGEYFNYTEWSDNNN